MPGPDSFFDNVCELDLVFNFYKVCDSLHCSVSLSLIRIRCTPSWTRSSSQERSKRRARTSCWQDLRHWRNWSETQSKCGSPLTIICWVWIVLGLYDTAYNDVLLCLLPTGLVWLAIPVSSHTNRRLPMLHSCSVSVLDTSLITGRYTHHSTTPDKLGGLHPSVTESRRRESTLLVLTRRAPKMWGVR